MVVSGWLLEDNADLALVINIPFSLYFYILYVPFSLYFYILYSTSLGPYQRYQKDRMWEMERVLWVCELQIDKKLHIFHAIFPHVLQNIPVVTSFSYQAAREIPHRASPLGGSYSAFNILSALWWYTNFTQCFPNLGAGFFSPPQITC